MGRETSAALKVLFERIEAWPEDAQEEAVRVLEELDEEVNTPLSQDDIAAIERGLEDVRYGRTYSWKEVRTIFDKYRGK